MPHSVRAPISETGEATVPLDPTTDDPDEVAVVDWTIGDDTGFEGDEAWSAKPMEADGAGRRAFVQCYKVDKLKAAGSAQITLELRRNKKSFDTVTALLTVVHTAAAADGGEGEA